MTAILRLSGIAFMGAFSSMLLKEKNKSAQVLISVATFLLIFAFSLKNGVSETVLSLKDMVSGTDFSEYAVILSKALGIAYVTSITESICKDAGELSLSNAICFAGKIQLIILSLPLISSILDIAKQLLKT